MWYNFGRVHQTLRATPAMEAGFTDHVWTIGTVVRLLATRTVVLTDIYFFTDETGAHTGGRHFIVAGVAFGHYRRWNRHDLLHAENVSLKGRKDWHETKNIAQRVQYIEIVLELERLREHMFYTHFTDTSKEHYWQHTVDTLCLAIAHFTDQETAVVHHQGLNGGSRDRLKKNLRERSYKVHVKPAPQELKPEVRQAG